MAGSRRGPTPTTRRSPGQGGREIRARVSREEFAAIRERAEAAGLSVPAYVLWCVLGATFQPNDTP